MVGVAVCRTGIGRQGGGDGGGGVVVIGGGGQVGWGWRQREYRDVSYFYLCYV